MVSSRVDCVDIRNSLLHESSAEPSVGGGGASILAAAPILAGYALCLAIDVCSGMETLEDSTHQPRFEVHIVGEGRSQTICLYTRL